MARDRPSAQFEVRRPELVLASSAEVEEAIVRLAALLRDVLQARTTSTSQKPDT